MPIIHLLSLIKPTNNYLLPTHVFGPAFSKNNQLFLDRFLWLSVVASEGITFSLFTFSRSSLQLLADDDDDDDDDDELFALFFC